MQNCTKQNVISSQIVRTLAILIMKYMLKKVKKRAAKLDNLIVLRAYSDMIKSYEVTISFLKANSKY